MIPGANILGAAFRAIQPQTLQLRAFVSRTESAIGNTIPTFATAVDIAGSMQPIDKPLYQQLGLNLAKTYAYLYVFGTVLPVARDRDGDVILYDGKTWQCEDSRDWSAVGEYTRVLCVEIPPL